MCTAGIYSLDDVQALSKVAAIEGVLDVAAKELYLQTPLISVDSVSVADAVSSLSDRSEDAVVGPVPDLVRAIDEAAKQNAANGTGDTFMTTGKDFAMGEVFSHYLITVKSNEVLASKLHQWSTVKQRASSEFNHILDTYLGVDRRGKRSAKRKTSSNWQLEASGLRMAVVGITGLYLVRSRPVPCTALIGASLDSRCCSPPCL